MKLNPSFAKLTGLAALALAALPAEAQYAANLARSFNGTNQYVAVPELALSNRSFTVETWLRRESSNRWDLFVSQGVGVNTNGLHVGFRPNNFFTLGFFGNDLNYATPFLDTNWHHWAVTFEAVTRARRIYLDGALVAEDFPATAYQGSGPLRLASTPFVSSSFFRGALDEFRVWTVARSQAEIQATRGRTLQGTEANLALYYRFDAGDGPVATNLATATGPAWDGVWVNDPAPAPGAPIFTAPGATTLPVTGLGPSYVTFQGALNANGGNTRHYFRFGTSTNYGLTTFARTNFGGTVSQGVSAQHYYVAPGTLHHYQFVAENGAGTNYGADLTFTTPASGQSSGLWGANDFVIANVGGGLVVLNPDLTFKRDWRTCGPPLCGILACSLDWFPNGDLLVANRFFGENPSAFRYSSRGDQLAYYDTDGSQATAITSPRDTKVSVTGTDIIAADYANPGPSIMRYDLATRGAREFTSYVPYGGLAVVPRANGTHELWAGRDPDFPGLAIYAMNAAGEVQFSSGPLTVLNVPAASVTMTYDPITHRVLYSNLDDGEIRAMDVETRTIARTYSVPVGQRAPGLTFTGLTSGPGGMIIGLESYEHGQMDANRRIGLSVWDADGSNYRFINLDGFPGFDLVDLGFGVGRIPLNIVWAGNCPAPKLADVGATEGMVHGTVTGLRGADYIVQGATNLVAPVWESIVTNAAPFEFTDPATNAMRFDRVVPHSPLVQ